MYNKRKVYVDKKRFTSTILCKYFCPFDAVVLIKGNIWVLHVQKTGHNHKPILSDTNLTCRKTAITQDI